MIYFQAGSVSSCSLCDWWMVVGWNRDRDLWRSGAEYVWLSATWWKQLRLSDRRVERNLLNDSIPPEKSQQICHHCLSYSHPLGDICQYVLGQELKYCDQKSMRPHRDTLHSDYVKGANKYAHYQVTVYIWNRVDMTTEPVEVSLCGRKTKHLCPLADCTRSHEFCICLHPSASYKLEWNVIYYPLLYSNSV